MLIADSHLDIAYSALEWNRDLTADITTIREAEAGMGQKGRGANVVCFPKLRRGGLGLIFVTMGYRLASVGKRFAGGRTQDICYARCMGELAYYRLMESKGHLRHLRDVTALDAHLQAWEIDPDRTPIGFVLTMEGADGIVDSEQVRHWWEHGLRIVSLVHYGISAYSHGTQAPGGLRERGRAMLQAMEAAGMALDVSHLAEQAYWEALDAFDGPLLATHNCCRALCDHDRQLDDEQIKALVARGGVMGVAFDDWMLSPAWDHDAQDNSQITLATVADHIDHICQLAGNADHAALGTDLDGGYGREQAPADLNTIADLRKVADILGERGYSDDQVAGIMSGNWVRFLRGALPAG